MDGEQNTNEDGRVVIALRSPQITPLLLTTVCAGLGVPAGMFAQSMVRQLGFEVRGAVWLFVFWAVGAGIVYGLWRVARPFFLQPRELVIDAWGLHLPRRIFGASRVIIWSEINELWVAPETTPQILVIDAARTSFVLQAPEAQNPSDLTRAYETIVRWLRVHGRDRAILEKLQKHRAYDLSFAERVPAATYAITAVLVAFFALEIALEATGKPLALLVLGGNSGALVKDGQLERLFTANLLHGGFVHLYVNAMSIWFVAALLERAIGRSRMSIVYLAAGVAGALASAATSEAISVGASTSVFGLLGAYAVIARVHRNTLPLGVRGTRNWWVFTLAINAGLPFFLPIIDWRAHVGGFVIGALVAALIARSPDVISRPDKASFVLHAVAATLVAAYVGAVGVVAYQATAGDARARILEAFARGTIDPILANNIAWEIVEEPDASEEAVFAALALVRRALPEVPAEAHAAVVDTLEHLEKRAAAIEQSREE